MEGNNKTITAVKDCHVFQKLEGVTIRNVTFTLNGCPIAEHGSYYYKTTFENVTTQGSATFSNNCGFFANYSMSGGMSFINCTNTANAVGRAGDNGYNAVFLGYKYGSYGTVEFKNCKNKGNLICGRASLFVANPNASTVRLKITDCSNEGNIQSTYVNNNNYKMNWYVSHSSNCTGHLYVNDIDYVNIQKEKMANLPSIFDDQLVANSGNITHGPENDTLSVVKNEDNSISIRPSSIVGVATYKISVGLYANLTAGGSVLQYADETVNAVDYRENEYKKVELKVLPFVDDKYIEEHPATESEGYGTIAGNVTYTVNGNTYYVIPDADVADTKGQVKRATILVVGAYDEDGILLASSNYAFN